MTNCGDLVCAYAIKDSAAANFDLATCWRNISSHTGGEGHYDIEEVGSVGSKTRMQ